MVVNEHFRHITSDVLFNVQICKLVLQTALIIAALMACYNIRVALSSQDLVTREMVHLVVVSLLDV